MTIRLATLNDFPAIYTIEKSAHFHPWPEAVLERYIKKPNSCWVLEQHGQIQGYAVNTLIAGEAELLMIAIAPSQQGQGLGRQLMQALLEYLQQANAEQWFLEVRASNQAAISLYESLGFVEVGVRKNYYPTAKGQEDAVQYCLAFE